MKLIALTLAAKVLAYAAVVFGAYLAYSPAGWIAGGALAWWLIVEEIEPYVMLLLQRGETTE